MTCLTPLWLKQEIGHIDLFGLPRNCSLIWTQKSTPGQRKGIPLPTPFAVSVVGKFHAIPWHGDYIPMLRGYLCMTHPLDIPYMVENEHLEGQG